VFTISLPSKFPEWTRVRMHRPGNIPLSDSNRS
jgi:hypothetical protein